ncbi:Deleted in malignant brain tumors 1 protein [Holothuria leucospilota]|uniref:Deleted in malignant brain tumors 1 protein n=1 Tax=Holothuria leucospilota TaxID=206669 RepID=A0A9Q1BJ90_HOLLE|nr:Deleted in malignant brain tumors 1 protein [Holothuria leucospilota]
MRLHDISLWLFASTLTLLPFLVAIKNGDVRLTNGTATYGRVELYNNGQWGTVCDDKWDMDDARVVCRQLGFRDTITAHGNALFGEGEGPIHISNVNCDGTESFLIECYSSLSDNCEHEDDASVTCLPFVYSEEGFVRLVGGNLTDGRVEIFFKGEWGTICDDTWDISDATVVCRQLGFTGAISAPRMAAFGEGKGPIHLDVLECSGSELTLLDCEYKQKRNCMHNEDAGVECFNYTGEGSVRLAGGHDLAGRVEIYKDNQWGTVCDDDWDVLDATVVCRQLGFKDAVSAPKKAAFGEGVGPIHIDSVKCLGDEESLLDCEYKRDADCTHNEDASATCRDVSYVSVGWIIIAILTLLLIVATTAGIFARVFIKANMNRLLRRIRNVSEDVPNTDDASLSSQPSGIPELRYPTIATFESADFKTTLGNLIMSRGSQTDSMLYTTIPGELILPKEEGAGSYENMAKCGNVEEKVYSNKIY